MLSVLLAVFLVCSSSAVQSQDGSGQSKDAVFCSSGLSARVPALSLQTEVYKKNVFDLRKIHFFLFDFLLFPFLFLDKFLLDPPEPFLHLS